MISSEERRLRLVERHHHGRTAAGADQVVPSVAALHSTDPTTPYLSSWARVPGFQIEDLDRLLYADRSLVRMHTIRRTLFVLNLNDAVSFEAGATRDIARRERARLMQWLAALMPESRVGSHVERLAEGVMAALGGTEMSTRDLSPLVPGLTDEIEVGSGKWTTKVPVSTRLLLIMAMDGDLVRARPQGTWRSSQYRWAVADRWFGGGLKRVGEEDGRAGLLQRYLETHGPATMTDIRWWTGWTAKNAREALKGIDARQVAIEPDGLAYLPAGDPGPAGGGSGVVALLPSLDSSTMGWKERDWYLGEYASEVFDSAGNAGPTVWAGGRIVGGWGQRLDGTVVYELLTDVPRRVVELVEEEARALTTWLGERVVMPRFPSPIGKRLAER